MTLPAIPQGPTQTISANRTGRPRSFLAALMRSIRRRQSSKPCWPPRSGAPALEAMAELRASINATRTLKERRSRNRTDTLHDLANVQNGGLQRAEQQQQQHIEQQQHTLEDHTINNKTRAPLMLSWLCVPATQQPLPLHQPFRAQLQFLPLS